MSTAVNHQTWSDAELIAATRLGDGEAFGELYRRHLPAARAAARAMCRNRSDADDLVSEAFLNMLRILQNGNGPQLAFRPYLMVAVRNRFYDRMRRRHEDPVDEPTEELNLALIDTTTVEEDKMLAAAAFATLPERWQLVLWHTEIEGRTPAEIAPLIGLAPNAVAALAYRAREGLRQAFLQAHLQTPRELPCRECAGHLGAYVRDSLSSRDRDAVDAHLTECESCRALLVELSDTNNMLRVGLLPAILGIPATAYLSGLGGTGLVAKLARMSRLQQAGAATAAAAAAVAAVVTVAIVSTAGNDPTIAAPPTTRAAVAAVADVSDPTSVKPAPVATATGTTIQLAALPPVPNIVTTTVPAGPVSGNPVRTVPRGVPTTAPAATPGTTADTTTITPSTTFTTIAAEPATTTSSTTVPVVPRLALTSLQLGVAVLGGEARVQLTVAASALPTNQFRTNAFANLVIAVPLPLGVVLTGADNPGWSCTAQGACTIASLASGASSSSVLRLGIAANVALPISFAPSVTSPANAVVQSLPLNITASAITGLQIQEFARGSVAAVGNTLVDCILVVCVPVDVDADKATFNSSTADLKFAGNVVKAVLVWSGDSKAADRGSVKMLTPHGQVDIVADEATGEIKSDYSAEYENEFVAFKDVTAEVTTSGSYGVANLQTLLTSYGGWSLIVVTHDPTQPERSLMIAVPLSYVTDATPSSLVVAGSSVSSAAHVVVSAFEGDEKLLGDTLKFGGFDLGAADAFHGAISGASRNPQLDRNRRVDVLDTIAANSGTGTATLDFATTDDQVLIAAVGVALDLS